MLYWTNYEGHKLNIKGKKKKYDNNSYTFDIETTSYCILYNKQYSPIDYLNFSEDEKQESISQGSMYIWMFGINNQVYYGRTWPDFRLFLERLEILGTKERKIVYVHNLSYEFQFLCNEFEFEMVFARKSRKVLKCILKDFNVEFRCSYYLSNVSLDNLSNIYNLETKKLVGNLDYNLARSYKTKLTDKELAYCENDCLVVYDYISLLIKKYKTIKNIPLTATGFVRGELKEKIIKDYDYRNKTRRSINTEGHIYNLLVDSFQGGYTHANWLYSGEIIKNVTSFDFTSSYPYCLISEKYPKSEFKKCKVKDINNLLTNFAYIIKIKFYDIESKFFNNIISISKCSNGLNISRDNGRVIKAKELEMTITDIDLNLIKKCYSFKSYEIIEIYYATKDYLPKQYINFILDKYELKTKYKGVSGKEVQYALEKANFNSLYGMTVTNNIRQNVNFDNITGWSETDLSNDEIISKLQKEKYQGFLSFAWGVWCTAYARRNLIENLIKLDEFVLYADTDSLKLKSGFNQNIIDDYNFSVCRKLEKVSSDLDIDFERFRPKDNKGKTHLLGLFELDSYYEEFITQGAKKYADIKYINNKKLKGNENIIYKGNDKSKILEITVSGVPKSGSHCLKNLSEFKDNLVFDFEHTNKHLIIYNDVQEEFEFTDYQGNKTKLTDRFGSCLLPTTYVLGRSQDYVNLISDYSSKRQMYYEGD